MRLIKLCLSCFIPSIGKVNKIDLRINFINRQKRAISMELLRNYRVKIINRCIKYTITNQKTKKVKEYIFPGSLKINKRISYGDAIGMLARG